MKKLMTLAITAVAAFPFLAFGQSEGYYDRSFTRLSYVKGDVYIQRAQDLGYELGEVNLVVVEGDKLGTREGRAEIQLGRGNILRLDRETQVDLAGLPGRDGDPTKIHLIQGSVFFRVRDLDREKNLQIHTPDASFYVLEAGLYRLDVSSNSRTDLSVYSGQAEAAGEDGSVLVRSGEMITAAEGRWSGGPSGLFARRDDFESWNESRDALYARRLSRTYLPADYADYDYELADYGRWCYEADYGYVWVPTIYDAGWRPYYHGRWVWYPIIGWTWVSAEPWGWCTSHYGRWGWRYGLGWYWIPMHRWSWGPAWVHWYNHYDYIGWCPLSYWDYPVVIINNHFYGRHHGGWDRHRDYSRSMTVVRRSQLQDRSISRIALNDRSGLDLGRISLGAAQPDIRPALERTSTLAGRAREAINRGALRRVGEGFTPSAGRPAPVNGRDLRAPEIKRPDGDAPSRELGTSRTPYSSGRLAERGTPETPRPAAERLIRPDAGGRPNFSGEGKPASGKEPGTMRVYPSRSSSPSRLADLAKRSFSSPPRDDRPAIRKEDPSSRSSSPGIQAYPSSAPSPSRRGEPSSRSSEERVRSSFPERPSSPGIRAYPSSTPPSSKDSSSSSRFNNRPSRLMSSSRSSDEPSRSYTSPSRRLSSPERSYSSKIRPRFSSSPPRSSSSSPRSSDFSSRSYERPPRSSSSSRSYNAPSRSSSSSSSRSVSRSSSSSSSSRSSGKPSRSSSSSSKSSSSSGSKSSGSPRRR